MNKRVVRYFDCYRCGKTNPDYLTFGIGRDKHCCLDHIPRWIRYKMRLRERLRGYQ